MLSRHPNQLEPGVRHLAWDGRTAGAVGGGDRRRRRRSSTSPAAASTAATRRRTCAQMMDSRVDSTRVVGEAIAAGRAAAARVAADEHRDDLRRTASTRRTTRPPGVIGGDEPDVPGYWAYSVDIAQALGGRRSTRPRTPAHAQGRAAHGDGDEPGPRRRLRRAAAAWRGWGSAAPSAGGGQYVSWIHDARLRARRRAADRARGPRRAGQPRRARARCRSATSWRRCARAWGRAVGLPATRGWRRSARSSSAPTPSCCSRAAAWCRAGCSTPGSRSSTRGGRRLLRTWSGGCGCAEVEPVVARTPTAPGYRPTHPSEWVSVAHQGRVDAGFPRRKALGVRVIDGACGDHRLAHGLLLLVPEGVAQRSCSPAAGRWSAFCGMRPVQPRAARVVELSPRPPGAGRRTGLLCCRPGRRSR